MFRRLLTIQAEKHPIDEMPIFRNFMGLNTVTPARFLSTDEASVALNWMMTEGGVLRPRPGAYKASSSACNGKIVCMAWPNVSGTVLHLIATDTGYIYRQNTSPASYPGANVKTGLTLTDIVPFNGKAILFTGGYLLYWDYNGGTDVFNICYDDGDDAVLGYMFTHLADDDESSIDLYHGGNLGVFNQETTSAFGAGLTIPATKVVAKLSKVGSPTGTIDFRLFSSAPGAIVTSTETIDVTTIDTNAAEFELSLPSGGNMSQSTAYGYGLFFTTSARSGSTGSDASNYVKVHIDAVASGGIARTYTTGVGWGAVDTTKTALMGLKPGLPPKGKYGVVRENRLFVLDSLNNPGKIFYSNVNTHLDWSTENGGGHFTIFDPDASMNPAGGMFEFYGALYIVGTREDPYLGELRGVPGAFELQRTGLPVSAIHRTIAHGINDVYFTGAEGFHSLVGVEQYGDVRTIDFGDSIRDKLNSYFDDGQVIAGYPVSSAAYWHKHGLYLVRMKYSESIWAFHMKHRRVANEDIVYPVCEWDLVGINPYYLTEHDGTVFIGGADGHIYFLSDSIYQDGGTNFTTNLTTGVIEKPYGNWQSRKVYAGLNGAGAVLTVTPYLNGGAVASTALSFTAGSTIVNQQNFLCRADSFKFVITTASHDALFHLTGFGILGQKLKGGV